MPDISLPEQVEQVVAVRRDEGGRYVKGVCGNPAGRPRSGGAAARAAEAVFEGAAAPLAEKALELALAGNAAALKLCLRHIVAPRRERAAPVALPPLREAGDIAPMMAAIAAGVAAGDLSAGEAGDLARLFETFMRAIEAGDFERRVQALERVAGDAATPA